MRKENTSVATRNQRVAADQHGNASERASENHAGGCLTGPTPRVYAGSLGTVWTQILSRWVAEAKSCRKILVTGAIQNGVWPPEVPQSGPITAGNRLGCDLLASGPTSLHRITPDQRLYPGTGDSHQ